MKVVSPEIVKLASNGIFIGRKPLAVFVRKHDLGVNVETVESQTRTLENPEKWLFLVEGYRKYHAVENLYLDCFTDEYKIKAEDPIVNPFTSEVADAASIEKIVGALSVLVMDYLDYIEQNNQIELIDNKTLEMVFNQSIDVVAKSFGISPQVLKRELNKLKWRDEEKLAEQLRILSIKRGQLISESNSQSKKKLVESLGRNNHPDLFIMSGIEHAPVFIVRED